MRQNYLRAAAGYRINQPTVDGDEHIANTELLLKGEGTNGQTNNTFVDSSASNHSITPYNDVTQGSFSPFSPKGWSGYFDSTNDALSLSASSDFVFGTGDFTWECWFNRQSGTPNSGRLVQIGPTWATNSSLGLGVYGSNHSTYPNKIFVYAWNLQQSTFIQSSITIADNEWHHVAVTRNNGVFYLYVDGVLRGSNSNYSGSVENVSTNTLHIGGEGASAVTPSSENFLGYISNARIVKGTALYTAAFTPPTEPLTAVTNTKLLTLQDNRFTDNSASNHSITVNGGTAIKATSPFSGAELIDGAGSMYFDGNGDYLDITSNLQQTGDFTIEFWFYAHSIAQNDAIYSWGNDTTYMNPCRFASTTSLGFYKYGVGLIAETGTNTVQPGQWYHVAVTKNSSNTLSIWLDGVLKDTYAFGSDPYGNSNGVHIGADANLTEYFHGYISDFRCVSSCLYTSNFTPTTSPLQPITNTKLLLNGNNGGVEDSLGKNTLQTGGNAQIDTTVKKFDSGSIQFDGSGDYLKTTGFDFSQKYTIEGWVYRQNHSGFQRIFIQGGSTWDWTTTGVHCTMYFENNTNLLTYEIPDGSNSTYQLKDSSVAAADTWHYVAATCDGTTTSLFLNGSRVATRTNVIPRIGGSEYYFSVGSADGIPNSSGGNYLKGFLDDFRVTIGVARYDPTQTSHTVPTKTHPTT